MVITRPDAVRGQWQNSEPSPVKNAHKSLDYPFLGQPHGSRVFLPCKRGTTRSAHNVVAGCILPDEVISAPYGALNVRVAAASLKTAQFSDAILGRDVITGVSIMNCA